MRRVSCKNAAHRCHIAHASPRICHCAYARCVFVSGQFNKRITSTRTRDTRACAPILHSSELTCLVVCVRALECVPTIFLRDFCRDEDEEERIECACVSSARVLNVHICMCTWSILKERTTRHHTEHNSISLEYLQSVLVCVCAFAC